MAKFHKKPVRRLGNQRSRSERNMERAIVAQSLLKQCYGRDLTETGVEYIMQKGKVD